MVSIKTARELSKMKDACRISAEALRAAGEAVKPGISTYEIDLIVRLPRFSVTAVFPQALAFPLTTWLSMAYQAKTKFSKRATL